MIQFTETKFRALAPQSKAKKCADLLHHLLDEPGENWKAKIRHYNELCRWQNHSELCLSPDTMKPSILIDAYKSWRELAGLGAEQSVLGLPIEYDRAESLAPPAPWWVWLHNIRSAHNVGSILRTIDCLGWSGAHLTGYTPRAEHAAVRSASMGAEKWVKTQSYEHTEEFFAGNILPIYALELVPESVPIQEFHWPSEGILLLGNEELGVHPDYLKKCAGVIQIPLFGRKGSLNVSQAFAIAAWEMRRKGL